MWRGRKTLDAEESRNNGAQMGVTSVYLAATANQCSSECCRQLKGICDVASYNTNQSECYHYHCSPIEKCKIVSNNDTDVFFSILSPGSDPLTQAFDMSSTTRPVSRGDGTRSKPRKGALLDDIPNVGGQLKQDNTTVVARKGVDSLLLLEDLHVPGENETLEPMNFYKSDAMFNVSSNETGNLFGYNGTEDYVEMKFSRGNRDDVVNSTVATQGLTEAVTVAAVISSSSTKMSPVTTVPESTLAVTLMTNKAVHTAAPTKRPFVSSTVVEVTWTPKPVVVSSTTSVASTSEVNRSYSNDVEHIVELPQVNSDSYTKLMSSASLHLVIGLVLGLMVLLTVLGLVGKRVHDSWQRRHYHRMDFLIDGMYHGDP